MTDLKSFLFHSVNEQTSGVDDSCVKSKNFIHLSHTYNQSKPVSVQFRFMTLWQISLLSKNVKKSLLLL